MNNGRADERWDVGQVGMLGAGERDAVSQFGLERAKFVEGPVERALVIQIKAADCREFFASRAVEEEMLRLVLAGNAHVPSSVEHLAEQEALGLSVGAHIVVEAFEKLVEFVRFIGVDSELRGVDAVLAGVELQGRHSDPRVGARWWRFAVTSAG